MIRRQFLVGCLLLTELPAAVRAADAVYVRDALRDFADRPTSLAAHAGGEALVVVVMKGHWCGVCIRQLARLGALRSQLQELGARVVGLNGDSVKANRAMAHEQGIPFAVLSDPSREILTALGLWAEHGRQALPAILVFDRCGNETARQVGRFPEDRPEAELLRVLVELKQRRTTCDRANA